MDKKENWQLTRKEFEAKAIAVSKSIGCNLSMDGALGRWVTDVDFALDEGKPVKPEILEQANEFRRAKGWAIKHDLASSLL